MHELGLTVGKFYPPHRGHKLLIDTASAQCRNLVVLICAKAAETIPGATRAGWLRRIHPDADVRLIEEPMPGDDDSEGWARFTIGLLGRAPDVVFTSEDYGPRYAHFLGSAHVCVDRHRVAVPISATRIRQDPAANAQFLEPCVRAHFVPRIVLIGAESTGKTTLAQALADRYRTAWVPEFGRLYTEGKPNRGMDAAWQNHEFATIARVQRELETALAESATGLLICDTDAFATCLWHERYMDGRAEAVEEIARQENHGFYLVTGDEIPFVQDGTRDGEHIRHAMQARIIERLNETGRRYEVVTGDPAQRIEQATAHIAAMMGVHPPVS